MRLVFLDGIRSLQDRRRPPCRQLRLVDVLVVDLERQRRGSAVTPRGEMVISLVFDSLVAGFMLTLDSYVRAFSACVSSMSCFKRRMAASTVPNLRRAWAARISSRTRRSSPRAPRRRMRAMQSASARSRSTSGRSSRQAAHHALSNVARQRLQAGLALRLFALRERLRRARRPLGVLELGDDAARHHALGQRRVLRHELDERRFRRRSACGSSGAAAGAVSRRPLAAQRVLAHAESLGGEPRGGHRTRGAHAPASEDAPPRGRPPRGARRRRAWRRRARPRRPRPAAPRPASRPSNAARPCARTKVSGSSAAGRKAPRPQSPASRKTGKLRAAARRPARSPSKQAMTVSVKRLSRRSCSAVSAVPSGATTSPMPAARARSRRGSPRPRRRGRPCGWRSRASARP